jgi:Zn-dependent membrane protease YugP
VFFDPLYLLVVVAPSMLLGLWAQYKVKSTFARFSEVGLRNGLSGAQIAQRILDVQGVKGVTIEAVDGFLSDHYDPVAKALRLSPDVYNGRSVSAAGVAAHEVGHALQHAEGYRWLAMRSALVPVVNFAAPLSNLALGFGFLLLQAAPVMGLFVLYAGVIGYGALLLFQLVTLPVEFDASRRALVAIERGGLAVRTEVDGAREVLGAAALTYVAAAVSSALTLLYYLWRLGLLGGRRE